MKPAALVRELEDALRQLGVRVRRERGSFRGGRCTVAGRETVVLNKLHPLDAHVLVLADALRGLGHEALYLRPAVRAALDDAWSQLDRGSLPQPAEVGADTEEADTEATDAADA